MRRRPSASVETMAGDPHPISSHDFGRRTTLRLMPSGRSKTRSPSYALKDGDLVLVRAVGIRLWAAPLPRAGGRRGLAGASGGLRGRPRSDVAPSAPPRTRDG